MAVKISSCQILTLKQAKLLLFEMYKRGELGTDVIKAPDLFSAEMRAKHLSSDNVERTLPDGNVAYNTIKVIDNTHIKGIKDGKEI